MKPVRVLMVVRLFYPWVGGTERQAHKLAQSLAEKGVIVGLVTGWWFPGTPQREMVEGIPVFRNHTLWEMFGIKGLRKFGGYLYILTLLWYLWRQRACYDIIHVHGLSYHTFAAVLAGRWFKRKTLTKLANSGSASDILKMRIDQQLFASRYMLSTALRCDRFSALTQTIKQELVAAGVPAEDVVELVNGVETDRITVKRDYALHNPPRLIFVGRLHEQKGLDILLNAFRQLVGRKATGETRLQLVGDGPLRDYLQDLAYRLGIARLVEFSGQTDQVIGHLQQADIFVLPSRAEGISNALLEAMACGLPAVVSDVPGNWDVVEHEKNGLLFTGENPESLAQALVSLLEQRDLREFLGRAARQTVEERYSLSYVADCYIGMYRDLLSTANV